TRRAREQDIRRERASSNVCTNQTLIAVAFAIHLSWLGTSGLRELALRCARGTRYAREALLAIDDVEPLVPGPVLRQFALRPPVAPDVLVARMAAGPRRSDRPAFRVGTSPTLCPAITAPTLRPTSPSCPSATWSPTSPG